MVQGDGTGSHRRHGKDTQTPDTYLSHGLAYDGKRDRTRRAQDEKRGCGVDQPSPTQGR